MLLYPELPGPVADGLINRLAALSIEEARLESDTRHPAATYAATGGNRIKENALKVLQQELRDSARQSGYPDTPSSSQKRDFDAISGQLLHQKMYITPSEAAKPEVWNFIACILLPDIVRWRFPGSGGVTSKERFQGKNRGMRNTFGRVWWRAQILYLPDKENPYTLLYKLGEDELVQIMERPGIAGSPALGAQISASFLTASADNDGISGPEILRDAMKRLRRLLPLVSFDALDDEIRRELIDHVFEDAVRSLSGRKASNQPGFARSS